MSTHNPERPGTTGVALGAVVVAICCGGPLLIAALATTGVGAAVAAVGWSAAGLVLIGAGLVIADWWWLRHRVSAAHVADHDRDVTTHG